MLPDGGTFGVPLKAALPRGPRKAAFLMPSKRESTKIKLNGEPYALNGERLSVAQLIESLKLKPTRVAVEINREIVAKAKYATTFFQHGDTVEIINFVGGG
jgi:sulfur carrier protein